MYTRLKMKNFVSEFAPPKRRFLFPPVNLLRDFDYASIDYRSKNVIFLITTFESLNNCNKQFPFPDIFLPRKYIYIKIEARSASELTDRVSKLDQVDGSIFPVTPGTVK